MQEKGHCEHGVLLSEGCPQCEADRMGEEGNTEASIAEAIKATEQTAKKIFCTSEEGCEFRKGAYCEGGLADCVFAEKGYIPKDTNVLPMDVEPEAEIALITAPGSGVEVMSYYTEALKLLDYAEKRVILTVKHAKTATDDLSLIANLKKGMESKKREYLDPLKAKVDAIRETYSTLMDPILKADRITREKILDFTKNQEELNRTRIALAEAEMKASGELSSSVVLVEETKKVSTDLGTSSLRDNWCFEVTDFALLPDEYKIADSVMLHTIAKKHHDEKQIPGVRFYNQPILAVRARAVK